MRIICVFPAHCLTQIVTLRKWLPQLKCYRKVGRAHGPLVLALRHLNGATVDAGSAGVGKLTKTNETGGGSEYLTDLLPAVTILHDVAGLTGHLLQVIRALSHQTSPVPGLP